MRSLLRKAIERDPDDASARLHLALAFVEWPDNGRDAYGEAVARRDGLSREDAATLHALEPLFLTDPPDRRTALGRLDALLAQRPNDAQRLFARARIRLHVDPQAALDDFTALLAVAPDFHAAMALRGELLLLHDRQEEGRREIDRCIAGSPNNTNCLRQRIRLNRDAGRCDEMVRDARRWRALDPTSSSARMFLAEGLAASEGYSAAVEELARQFGENVPLVGRPGMPEQMVARVLAGRGRFDEAQRLVEASTEKRRAIDVVWPHELAVRFEVRALDESGRRGDAAAAAERYFSQRSLWPAEGRNDDLGIGHDPSGLLLAAMADGGRLAESELHSRLRETVTEWHGRATERSRRYIAPYVVALAATTPERAEALHDASFDADALPRLFPGNPGHAYLGQHLLAAGRTERALPHLEQATRACYQVMFPVVSTRAWLHLGQTRQQLGDTEGACAAFRVVLDRWGSAQPRSRSADAARIAARTLSCGL